MSAAPRPQLRVLGFPVHIEPLFLVVAVMLGSSLLDRPLLLVVWVVVLLASVLWHELAHALAFRSFGRSSSIRLHGMGGVTTPEDQRPLRPAADLVVSAAGPLAGLLLAIALLSTVGRGSMSDGRPLVQIVVGMLVSVNVALSLFNLLPVLPLDGGRVTQSVLNLATGGRGLRPALAISLTVALTGAVYALTSGRLLLALLAGWFAFNNGSELLGSPAPGARGGLTMTKPAQGKPGAPKAGRGKPDGKKFKKAKKSRFGMWCGVAIGILLALYLLVLANSRPRVDGDRLRLDEFVGMVGEDRIRDARILDQDEFVVGRYTSDDGQEAFYNVPYPPGSGHSSLVELLLENRVPTVVDHQFSKRLLTPVTLLLPALIVVVVFIYLIVSYQRGTGLFGLSSGARQIDSEDSNATFADVAGQEAAVTELREVRDFLSDPERFAAVGAQVPKGILLYGPPGCGKTLLARAVAGEAGAAFFSISGSDFVELYVGVGAARVRDLFREARENAPAIVFIDELDSVGRRRGGGGTGGAGGTGSREEQEQALNQILAELDGFSPMQGIIVIGATNRPDVLDPALLRPGRFDRSIGLERPDEEGRRAILQVHARNKPIDPDVDLTAVAHRAIGLSGADLASVVNEGALLAARAGRRAISRSDLESALDRILEAPERQRRLSMRDRTFGRSTGGADRVSFSDVAGVDEAVEELAEVKEYLSEPERFAEVGGRPPRGFLLVGPPGVGKTMLAKAVAHEANAAFFSVASTEFVEVFAGEGAGRVRDLFAEARSVEPAIIFIDEIDAIGARRGVGLDGQREREQTLNQILIELDGFQARAGVIVLAASNRPEILDEALVRPGRFDRTITINLPDRAARQAILQVHAKGKTLGPDIDFHVVAGMTRGFSGADLANVLNEAALLTARNRQPAITMAMVEEAVQRVGVGVARTQVLSDEERSMVAYHELGHALVGRALGGAKMPHKVSIVARGRSLGATWHSEDTDRVVQPRSVLIDQMAGLLGGRVAEELVFGEPGSGAADDLARVEDIARRMVCELGMSDAVGPRAYSDVHGEMRSRWSEEAAARIDAEVGRLIREAYGQARAVLMASRDALDRAAAVLIEKETLSAPELDELAGPPPVAGRPVPASASVAAAARR